MNFNSVLIPVDFSVNTEVAILKGIELCQGPDPSIHLLHVQPIAPSDIFDFWRYMAGYPYYGREEQNEGARQKLKEWLFFIRQKRNDITTFFWIVYDNSVEKAIIKKTKTLQADLVIVAKNSQHSMLPFLNTVVSSRIAQKTGAAVLTVKPGALGLSMKMVVVPIGSGFPERKIEIINSLRSNFKIHIRLLILVEKSDDPELLQTSLLNICRVLRNRSQDNISYEVLRANNKGWDILNYCLKVNADLLIVQPESETRIGWLNKHISDELPVNSRTQVLAVGNT
ncbi:MAG TPA: universal stress protein [Chitinophagaceae bacterium]|nr:universal stress protein [Chitinophagaceae bacterium]